MITLATIRTMAKRLPGTVESTSYGTPALKVKKKLIARMHQKEDAIVILLNSMEEQQALIARDPMCYYITDHYRGYPAVLVRPTIADDTFFELLTHAWLRVAAKADVEAYRSANPRNESKSKLFGRKA